ncbi:MAG: hypothetical protein DRG78_07840 [Epsilonproteobacteria bacterium]|nr:MAG: hypothetical protein DRG78_07840 [Campylobacterota bacterium]
MIKTKGKQMIKKLLLGLLLTTGLMMANTTSKDDLLSLATMGKTTGNALEMNKTDMEKADGGYNYGTRSRYIRHNIYNLNHSTKSMSIRIAAYNTMYRSLGYMKNGSYQNDFKFRP